MSAAGIDLRYSLRRRDFALDVALQLPLRGITGIYGASGSGKTTLLRCVAGLEPGATGYLRLGDEIWQDSERSYSRPVQDRAVGYVFQEPRLFSHLDVQGNLAYARRRRRRGAASPDEAAILELLGIGKLVDRGTGDLSGGEAQRVAIARALFAAPRLVLMDEPLASLDRARRGDVLPFLDRLHAELSLPILYVSHSIEEICRLCDHLVILDRGRVRASGDLQSVLTRGDDMLEGDEAGSVIEARIRGQLERDELTELEFSGGALIVAGVEGDPGARLRLRIRASDVSLCRERPAATSILNIVEAVVEELRPGAQGMAVVSLRVGEDRLLARVSRRSIRGLALEPGDRLYAQIKSASIRNVPASAQLDRPKILC